MKPPVAVRLAIVCQAVLDGHGADQGQALDALFLEAVHADGAPLDLDNGAWDLVDDLATLTDLLCDSMATAIPAFRLTLLREGKVVAARILGGLVALYDQTPTPELGEQLRASLPSLHAYQRETLGLDQEAA